MFLQRHTRHSHKLPNDIVFAFAYLFLSFHDLHDDFNCLCLELFHKRFSLSDKIQNPLFIAQSSSECNHFLRLFLSFEKNAHCRVGGIFHFSNRFFPESSCKLKLIPKQFTLTFAMTFADRETNE